MPPVIKAALRPSASSALSALPDRGLRLDELLQAAMRADAPEGSDAANVIPLVAPTIPSGDQEGGDLSAGDWPQMLECVHDFGARVRRASELARDLSHRAQEMIRRSVAETEEAEERARRAETSAREAAQLVEQAQAQVRAAEERARLAEGKAEAAQASEADARLWLKRVYNALRTECASLEFDSLVDGASSSPA